MKSHSAALLMLLLAVATIVDSNARSKKTSDPNPPSASAAQPATPDQRGTDKVPFAVKIIPRESSKEETEKEEAERREKASVDKEVAFETQRVADYTWYLAAFSLLLTIVAAGQAGLFVWQLRYMRQGMRDAETAAKASRDSADAAKLNANALMIAEAAQMYLIIEDTNLARLYQLGVMYDNSPTMHPSPSDAPWVTYRLRNYGKSPAIVQSVFHGMVLYDPNANPSPEREIEAGQDGMEIIGVGEQGQVLKCSLDRAFNFGDVRSIITNKQLLSFWGHAAFIDHFGRKQTLEWEFIANDSRWSLIAHRNTQQDENK